MSDSNTIVPLTLRLELVEGTAATLPDGTTVNVKGIGYAHFGDSQNLSNATLVLARRGETAEVPLGRFDGGANDKAPPGTGLGWEFTLELVGAYQQPSSAIVQARKLD